MRDSKTEPAANVSTKFFTNENGNSLFKKFKGAFEHISDLYAFHAVVGYSRASGYYAIREHLQNVPEVKILVGINVDVLSAEAKRRGLLFFGDPEKTRDEFVRWMREPPIVLSNDQKLKFCILRNWRLKKSKLEKTGAFQILTDEEIKAIVVGDRVDKNKVYDLLPKKKAIRYGEEIVQELSGSFRHTIGKVVNVWYQDDNGYDRVKLKIEKTGEEKWFDTTMELPYTDKFVAAKLNSNWFNEYFYLDN
jgi:hypothetical protein